MKTLRSWVKLSISVLLGVFFLWLAFRNVQIEELLHYLDDIRYGWIFPFTLAILVGHYFRAERWRLLIREREQDPHRLTLFSGVMMGFLLNFVFPRLGEVTRPVYVAKREKLSSSNLFGTVVLERVIDMITLILLLVFVFIYIIADVEVLQNIFGEATISFFRDFFEPTQLLYLGSFLVFMIAVLYGLYRGLMALSRKYEPIARLNRKVRRIVRTFVDGLVAIREVERWGSFLGFTVIIWFCYVLMTYIPFWMFNMQEQFQLGLPEALTVMTISAIGIVIPTPGGIGTYHYFVKQSLWILFAVPAVTGLAFATVTHAVQMLVIIVCTPLIIIIERLVVSRTSTGSFSLRDIKTTEK